VDYPHFPQAEKLHKYGIKMQAVYRATLAHRWGQGETGRMAISGYFKLP